MSKAISLAEHLAAARLRVKASLAGALAAEKGPPADAVKLSDKQQAERWHYRDPKADPLALAAQGRTAAEIGMSLYPYRLDLLKAQGENPVAWVKYAEKMSRTAPPAPSATPEPSAPAADESAPPAPTPEEMAA